MMPADFTCCLCRTNCEKAADDKNDIVPRFFPFEMKVSLRKCLNIPYSIFEIKFNKTISLFSGGNRDIHQNAA